MDAILTTQSRYIDVVILTTLPPNCVNRDDSGRPKTVLFGGAQRQSPSSQFLKRGWRRASVQGNFVTRSLYAGAHLAEILGVSDNEYAKKCLADVIYSGSFKGKKAPEGKTASFIFYGDEEIKQVAELIRPHLDSVLTPPTGKGAKKATEKALADIQKAIKKDVEKALLNSPHEAAVISLYGRMTTGKGLHDASDAALSVARAMSTSKVAVASDYFTAVDDDRPDDSDEGAGAGHIGRKEFVGGSNILIQYRINLDLLRINAGFVTSCISTPRQGTPEQEEALQTVVSDFIRTSLLTPMPGAANQGVFSVSPRTHAAVVRTSLGMPNDMAPAFMKPSPSTNEPGQDADRLFSYLEESEVRWGASEACLKYSGVSSLDEFANAALISIFGE